MASSQKAVHSKALNNRELKRGTHVFLYKNIENHAFYKKRREKIKQSKQQKLWDGGQH